MSRERLMAAQRKRREEAKAKKQSKPKAKKSTTKKSVTRDTSKDKSRKEIKRLTGGSTPKTGPAAAKALKNFAGKQPTPSKAKPKPPASTGIAKASPPKSIPKKSPTKAETPPTKPQTAKESLYQPGKRYGGGPIATDDGTSRRSKSYAGVLPGTPEKKEVKKKPKRNVRGAAARRNRSKAKPSLAELSEKTITIGGKKIRMIVKDGKWVPKNKK